MAFPRHLGFQRRVWPLLLGLALAGVPGLAVADKPPAVVSPVAWTAPADLGFSDPANVAPPPAGAIGFPTRGAEFDVLPGFRTPPPGYGEVGFYWWVGDPLTRERLAWQLDRLAEVDGVMGLQINYAHSDRGGMIYGLTFPSEPPLFSTSWWDLVGWFMGEARQRGMAVSLSDYTLGIGQGWKIDEMLRDHPDLQGSVLDAEHKDVAGGTELRWPLAPGQLAVVAYPLGERGDVRGAGTDLRGFVADGVLAWSAPAGIWRIVAVRSQPVVPSLDPMHPRSGEIYARGFFGQFTDRFPGQAGRGLNWFFSDELEFRVQGWLWNDHFAAEFRRRKGYDLVPELPGLFFDVGPRTPKLRLDYSDVKVALTEEGFFKPVFEWHQQRGMIYGCDHGGRGRNVTEFGDYFRTQRWNQGPGCDQPGLGRDVIKNKVASSIAHLYQRPRVWLEGYYGSGWGTTTEQLTDATFSNFVQGQNLLTLHGLYYTTHGGWWEWAPPCNHFRMPYWPHMKSFFACTQRLSFLLSQGEHRCDVAILYPVAPAEAGLGGEESVQTAFQLGEHLYAAGIDFDFMDFESLARSRIEDQALHVSGERYRVLILPAMRAVRWSTLEKALEFERAGGKVILLGTVPEASDRLGREDPELDTRVRGLSRRAQTPADVRAQVESLVSRDFVCTSAVAGARQPEVMHRRIGRRDVYAVYGAAAGSECVFRAAGRVELWDPWTGMTQDLPVLAQEEGRTRLRLPLSEKEIQLVVFSPGVAHRAPLASAVTNRVAQLDGPWEFQLQPTLDNRFGDFRWPPTRTVLGAEARRFRYADESASDPGWQAPGTDDSAWSVVSAGFGPRFWLLGPLPDGVDAKDLESRLASLDTVDPATPLSVGDRECRWRPYAFSWRWGIEQDPGHQGYHGLKEEVHDEFIGLGRLQMQATGTSYAREEGGSRYYLWTTVAAGRGGPAHALAEGLRPAAAWLNHAPLSTPTGEVQLQPGANPLLLRYDSPGKGSYVVRTSAGDVASGAPAPRPLATRWASVHDLLPFDTRPQSPAPAGWYRFTSPPGLRAMNITAHGSLRAWANGRPMSVERIRERNDGATEYRGIVEEPVGRAVVVALRVEQGRGAYGGAALPEPIALDCGPGLIQAGDWTRQGVLECYSGGAWYRKDFQLPAVSGGDRLLLDLGNLSASAEVRVNGRPAGTRVAPPWRFDLTGLVTPGTNRLEILVLSALGGHYTTIPTRYPGPRVSGLLGPVTLESVRPTAAPPSGEAASAATDPGQPATYQNPIIDGDLADPAVIRHEGIYYLYATGEVDGDNGTRVYTSSNLVTWQAGPVVFRPGPPHVWAPDVWRDPDSGRFYLYYTVNQTVGVAEADGPLGPFTVRRKFFEQAIDAHLFRDDDGKLYLYYVQLPGFRITVQPMASPIETAGEGVVVLQPESEWETRAGRVTEGPWMIKRAGLYHLLYSGSGASTPDYAVGYATARSPLGPFTRAPHNPIIQRSEGLYGPGHGCAVQDPQGGWWHVYHQKRTSRDEWPRFIALDPLWFDTEGNLHGRATRGATQPAPAVMRP